jgi:hypothetical protein
MTKINERPHFVRKVQKVGSAFMFELGQNIEEAHDFGSIKAASEAVTHCINHNDRKYKISHAKSHLKTEEMNSHKADTRFM